MNRIFNLNEPQHELVNSNIDIVMWTIRKHIHVNETIYGLGYDDLFQEGCLWLCKAAVDYDGSTLFSTFAKTVVKNGLVSYCRNLRRKQQAVNIYSLEYTFEDKDFDETTDQRIKDFCETTGRRNHEEMIAEISVSWLLESLKHEYEGTVRLGIEALEWKVKGYTGADIARMYGVGPNLVGAWISRAKKKLLQNERFMSSFG